MMQADPVDEDTSSSPSWGQVLNEVATGLRGGSTPPDKPLRGAEKTTTAVINDLIELIDGAVRSRIGEDAGMAPAERMLIANGSSRYLPSSIVTRLAGILGPIAICAGVGLWAWRIYDIVQERAADRRERSSSPLRQVVPPQAYAPPQPEPMVAQAQPAPVYQPVPEQSVDGMVAAPNYDWRSKVERS